MILGLNQEEFALAKELTNVALANASASFSKLTGEQFTFQDIQINTNNFKLDKSLKSVKEPLFVLLTEYFGDILADTFLIISPDNAKKISEKLYPSPNINNDLQEAILLETDNILAAAVATKYADFLGHSVTGDVPRMVRRSPKETQEYVNTKLEHDHTHFSFITNFKSKSNGLEAYFVCAFKDSFANALKSTNAEGNQTEWLKQQDSLTKQYLRKN